MRLHGSKYRSTLLFTTMLALVTVFIISVNSYGSSQVTSQKRLNRNSSRVAFLDRGRDGTIDRIWISNAKIEFLGQIKNGQIDHGTFKFAYRDRVVWVGINSSSQSIYLWQHKLVRHAFSTSDDLAGFAGGDESEECSSLRSENYELVDEVIQAALDSDKSDDISCTNADSIFQSSIEELSGNLWWHKKIKECFVKQVSGLKYSNPEDVEMAHASLKSIFDQFDGSNWPEQIRCNSEESSPRGFMDQSKLPFQISFNKNIWGVADTSLSKDEKLDTIKHELIHGWLCAACSPGNARACKSCVEVDQQSEIEIKRATKLCICGPIDCSAKSTTFTRGVSYVDSQATERTEQVVVQPSLEMVNPMPPLKIDPVVAHDVLYAPAAELLAQDPKAFRMRTARVARPIMEYGERLFSAVKKHVKGNMDLIPVADAEDFANAKPLHNKAIKGQVVAANTQPKTGSVKNVQGPVAKPATATAAPSKENTEAKNVVSSDTNDRVDAMNSQDEPAQVMAPGTVAVPVSATVRVASSGGGGGQAKSGGTATGSTAASRQPAAVNPQAVSADQVRSEVKSLKGEELLGRLKDETYIRRMKRLGISVFDLQNNIYGADPSVAKSCYLIRKLERAPTQINCVARSKRD